MPGAGAAGGIGASLHVFAGAELCRGIVAVLSLVEFDKLLRDADIVITGEGRVDYQSAFGKVVHGVAQYANAARVPVIVIAGSIGDGAEAVYDLGVSTMVALPDAPMTLEYCIENAADLMKKAADRVFTLIRLGQSMKCD
jgi:glycerate kinase